MDCQVKLPILLCADGSIEVTGKKFVPVRTCRMVRETGIKYKFRCTACEDTTYEDEPFYCKRYCPNCGAKVVK